MSLLASDQSVETERLLLRRVTRDDLPFFARIHADPDVARFLSHGNPRTLDETTHWVDSVLESYSVLELGQIAITRRSDGALLGRCGVSQLETEMAPQPDGSRIGYYYPARAPAETPHVTQHELGYTLDRAAWGHGYAREAVRAMWSYLSTKRPDLELVSLIHPDNARSIRLAASFGATLVDRVKYLDRNFDRYAWPVGKSPSMDR